MKQIFKQISAMILTLIMMFNCFSNCALAGTTVTDVTGSGGSGTSTKNTVARVYIDYVATFPIKNGESYVTRTMPVKRTHNESLINIDLSYDDLLGFNFGTDMGDKVLKQSDGSIEGDYQIEGASETFKKIDQWFAATFSSYMGWSKEDSYKNIFSGYAKLNDIILSPRIHVIFNQNCRIGNKSINNHLELFWKAKYDTSTGALIDKVKSDDLELLWNHTAAQNNYDNDIRNLIAADSLNILLNKYKNGNGYQKVSSTTKFMVPSVYTQIIFDGKKQERVERGKDLKDGDQYSTTTDELFKNKITIDGVEGTLKKTYCYRDGKEGNHLWEIAADESLDLVDRNVTIGSDPITIVGEYESLESKGNEPGNYEIKLDGVVQEKKEILRGEVGTNFDHTFEIEKTFGAKKAKLEKTYIYDDANPTAIKSEKGASDFLYHSRNATIAKGGTTIVGEYVSTDADNSKHPVNVEIIYNNATVSKNKVYEGKEGEAYTHTFETQKTFGNDKATLAKTYVYNNDTPNVQKFISTTLAKRNITIPIGGITIVGVYKIGDNPPPPPPSTTDKKEKIYGNNMYIKPGNSLKWKREVDVEVGIEDPSEYWTTRFDYDVINCTCHDFCSRCGGDDEVTCTRCNGRGYYSCSSCGGDGEKSRYDRIDKRWEYYDCGSCGGDGEHSCSRTMSCPRSDYDVKHTHEHDNEGKTDWECTDPPIEYGVSEEQGWKEGKIYFTNPEEDFTPVKVKDRPEEDPYYIYFDRVVHTSEAPEPILTITGGEYWIDRTKPIINDATGDTDLFCTGSEGKWTNKDVTFEISAVDDNSNADEISEMGKLVAYVAKEGGSTKSVNGSSAGKINNHDVLEVSHTLKETGVYEVTDYGEDKSDPKNTNKKNKFKIYIDKISPVVEYKVNENAKWNPIRQRWEVSKDNAYFYVRVTDAGGSELKAASYQVGWTVTESPSTPFTAAELAKMKNKEFVKVQIPREIAKNGGKAILSVRGIDGATNEVVTSTLQVLVDGNNDNIVPDGMQDKLKRDDVAPDIAKRKVPANDIFINTSDIRVDDSAFMITRVYDVKWKNSITSPVRGPLMAAYMNKQNDTIGMGYRVDLRYDTVGYGIDPGDVTDIDVSHFVKVGNSYEPVTKYQVYDKTTRSYREINADENKKFINLTFKQNAPITSASDAKLSGTIENPDASKLALHEYKYVYDGQNRSRLIFNYYLPSNMKLFYGSNKEYKGNEVLCLFDIKSWKFYEDGISFANMKVAHDYTNHPDSKWGSGNGNGDYGSYKNISSLGDGQTFWYDAVNDAEADVNGGHTQN